MCDGCDNKPHIGENGSWYVGDTDTGIKAQGPAGQDADLAELERLSNEMEKITHELRSYQNVLGNIRAGHDVYTQIKSQIVSGKKMGVIFFSNAISGFPPDFPVKTGYIEFINHEQSDFVVLRCFASGQVPVDGEMSSNASGITWHL